MVSSHEKDPLLGDRSTRQDPQHPTTSTYFRRPPEQVRRLSRSRDSSPVQGVRSRLLSKVGDALRIMSSYGAIGDDQDELDRLLTRDRPTVGQSTTGATSSGMRRTQSAADSSRVVASSPDMRRVPSTVGTRTPYMYTGGLGLGDAMGSTTSLNNTPEQDEAVHRDHNMAIRYRLFNRLDPGGQTLRMPDHVTPSQYFSILPFDDFMDASGKQGSFVTIFSIWNTMMGTSLLAMPWAIEQAGLVWGIFLLLAMAAICCYTAQLVVDSPNGLVMPVDAAMADFSDVCRYLFGVWGERTAVGFSIVVLLGGVMVYWVLMSNFLYYTGTVVYEALQPNSTTIPIMTNKTFTCDVYCPDKQFSSTLFSSMDSIEELLSFEKKGNVTGGITFDNIWTLQGTVPIFLAILCFPLLNFKSPTFFTKFNVLGTVSVMYLIIFTASKLVECGFNMDFSDATSEHYVELFRWRFPSLTGTATLSYFVHNAALVILRNQKNPENNRRDLTIGYVLSAVTYVFIGFTFYAGFPTWRNCIDSNFLNNFGTGDVMSATARLFLLFQMITVLPLLMFLIRSQFFYAFNGKAWPGVTKVCILNACVVVTAASMAIFYPKVGQILRYVGSLTGLVYVFALPCMAYIKKKEVLGQTIPRWHRYALYTLIFLGAANAFSQVFV